MFCKPWFVKTMICKKSNGVLVTVNYPRLLLVSDSLAKNFVNDHVEVLAVPGGRVATLYDVLDVVPRNRTYEGVIIFIGGNSYGQWRGAPVLTPEFVISFFFVFEERIIIQ